MKTCRKCSEEKPRSEFYRSAKNRDGLHSYCKNCNRLAKQKSINKDRKSHNKKQRDRYARNKQLVWDYLSCNPCIDCGERDPVVLEFDHVRGVKDFNVSDGMQYSIERISKEIEKCEVRCSNCHKRITFARRNHAAVAQ